MGKISAENRQLFNARIEPHKAKVKEAIDKEKNMLALILKDTSGVGYKKILLCENQIFIATEWITVNNLSVELLETKNNDSLNDARKSLYKAVIYLEDVVSSHIDCPYSDLEGYLAEISNIPLEKRFFLIKKLGLAITLLIDAFGENTKWKWSFVELQGRFEKKKKNMLDMKQACKDYFDPRSPDYENTVLYVRMLLRLLENSAGQYRDRYELSTHRLDDMRCAINYLLALRRLQILINMKEESEEIKKKALVWKDKMESDHKAGIAS